MSDLDETMGLSSSTVLSQLESAEGLQEVNSTSTSILSEEELLFGKVHDYGVEENKQTFDDVDPEERINLIVSNYEQVIETLKQDFNKKLLDSQNKPDTMSTVTNNRDHRHMVNCLRAIEKRLINKQYDKALIDTQMSIEDFESE